MGLYTCETPRCLGEAQFCEKCLQKGSQELLFKRDVEWTQAVLGGSDSCQDPKTAKELLDANFDLLDRIIENLREKLKALRKTT